MKRRLFQVDAFTQDKFLGNPAGIVLDADGLTENQMQQIARELNNTETAFILKSDSKEADIQVRFFTPMKEIAMCGHNTVALHVVRALEGDAKPGKYVQSTKAGLVGVEIIAKRNSFQVIMTQTRIEYAEPLSAEKAADLLKALGLRPSDLRNDAPIQGVSTGNRKIMVPVKRQETLDALTPDFAALKLLGPDLGCTGYYPFVLEETASGVVTHGRMFGPQVGIDEDPVTGMAIAPMGAYVVASGLVKSTGDCFEFTARQGKAMGRPGQAQVRVTSQNGVPTKVDVSGEAVVVFKTLLES